VPPPPETLALAVLYEDDHLIAVDKPTGLVVHPTYKHPAGTVLDALRARASSWGAGDRRPSILGRLDKPTSGLVLAAKSARVHAIMQQTLAGAAEKLYLAVVHGCVEPVCGTIELRLARDPADRRRVVASAERGAPSTTLYERLAQTASCALLRCRIRTGRMHQIRVHLASRGWPVAGDAKYGDAAADAPLGAPRLALHAWRLAFVHPVTREPVRIEAPLPDDLQHLLERTALAGTLP
jgi:23S rRNA pseudouridine1911/1915/1917 synthase